jgi:hypothetical protein
MAIGCDFVCENPDCKAYHHRLSLNGSWPIVDIDDLIALPEIQKDPKMLEILQIRKGEGRTHACAILPNKAGLKIKGFRNQLFCPVDLIVWDEDCLEGSEQPKLDSIKCRRCNGNLISLEMAKKNGLNCPYCKNKMEPNYWFTNN